jgi:hypothetical protein
VSGGHPPYTLDHLRATAVGSHERFLVLTRDHAREMLASVEAEISAAYERGKAEYAASQSAALGEVRQYDGHAWVRVDSLPPLTVTTPRTESQD